MHEIDWLDVFDIAIELNEKYPEIDPQWIGFPDLHKKICNLNNFVGDPEKSNEKSQSTEVILDQVSDSDSKQDKTNKEEAKS